MVLHAFTAYLNNESATIKNYKSPSAKQTGFLCSFIRFSIFLRRYTYVLLEYFAEKILVLVAR